MSTGEMIRMRNPAGTGCGWRDTAYAPDEHGVVTVPAEALLDLLSHEFRPVPDEPAPVAEKFGEWLQDSVDSVLDEPEPEPEPEPEHEPESPHEKRAVPTHTHRRKGR